MKQKKRITEDKLISNIEKRESFLNNTKQHKILLVVLIIIVFGNTVFNYYSLDDSLDIFENEKVMKGIAGIPEIFTSSFCIINNAEFDYRPISPATFAIEFQLFGFNPHLSHFFNVVLYIGVVLLLYNFLGRILHKYKPVVILIITILFTIHPLHTEVVASLKNRQELLAFSFGFLALIRVHKYIYHSQSYKHILFAVIFMTLSLLSKLSALPFIGIIIVMLLTNLNFKIDFKNSLIALLFVAIPLIIIYFTKDWLFRNNYTFDESPLFFASMSEKIGTTFKIYLYYFRLLLIPYPLCFYYGFDTIKLIPFYHPVSLAGIGLFAFLLIKTFHWLKEKNIKGLLLLFFLMSISIFNNVTFTYPGMLSDRAMFMSSSWCIALIVLILYDRFFIGNSKNKNPLLRNFVMSLFALFFLYYVIWSVKRNNQWKSQLSIMEADIPHLQNSSFSNFLYGWSLHDSYSNSGDINEKEKAMYYLHRATDINKNMAEPNYRLGLIKKYYDNDLDSAEFYYRKYVQLFGNNVNGYKEFALTCFYKRLYTDALPYFDKVYKVNPTDTINLFYYVQTVFLVNGAEPALKLNEKLMLFASNTQYPYINNATIYKLQHKNKEALENLENVVKYGGSSPQVLADINLLKNY